MHDSYARITYEADTVVADTPHEDELPQIHLDDGMWHRPVTNGGATACGVLVNYRHGNLQRVSQYRGRLCPQCFTPFELSMAERINRDEQGEP